ncbi:YcbK family protein [Chthonobacter albigriseus]|uniref:YcbK family protein n=1 Tax=Chthonobacter albigriseus TaxID=1683161 RepID=UPI0015EEB261|nr:D-Ala-D-Ala carboxypeptidase family metallohydrolase [Chthonobacter albigriseus]
MRRLAVAALTVLSILAWSSASLAGTREELEGLDDEVAAEAEDAPELAQRTLVAFVHQTRTVRSSCLTPKLRAVLGKLRDQFGRQIILTSGYRPPGRARPGSYHRRCMAADIQIPGVAPSRLARAARNLAGIGGVGTYCHTRSVHVDVGPRRDWAWGCRKKKRRR